MEYTFRLKYQLPQSDSDPGALVECLAASCDDALVGIGQPGRLALEFSREAENAREAICTALADVEQAIPSARLIEVSPDLAGLTDVADIVGISRQAMRKLMLTHRSTFPVPIHEGSVSIWHMADVLDWLKARGGYQFDEVLLDVARMALEVNVSKEVSRYHDNVPLDRKLLTA